MVTIAHRWVKPGNEEVTCMTLSPPGLPGARRTGVLVAGAGAGAVVEGGAGGGVGLEAGGGAGGQRGRLGQHEQEPE